MCVPPVMFTYLVGKEDNCFGDVSLQHFVMSSCFCIDNIHNILAIFLGSI